ncbi:hypothetical protein O181_060929 [Austropuccinia psidii MF-1]|uniref:NAD(P)-binding protein n=1 Tax=Austropuccinia psidii MF-1 TaxID=1389203 RepID=A0A9Q3I035_9BASI|nr:hypothetical protein [Austropuccinia psidii MF-1]
MLLVAFDWFLHFLVANVPFFRVRWNAKQMPKLNGRVALVTGGNCGLGLATCLELARHEAKVYIACRSEARAHEAIKKIKDQVPNAQIEFIYFDLTVLSSAKAAAETLSSKESRLDILVNNAGITMAPYELSVDGIEIQACNGTGHFALTTSLLPLLKNTASSVSDSHVRIVNVSSAAHIQARQPDFSSLEGLNNRRKKEMDRYAYSKLSNILLTNELQRRLSNTNIYCLSVHPGAVDTEIARYLFQRWPSVLVALGKAFMRSVSATPTDGALTQLYAATSPEIETKDLKAAYLVPYGQVAKKSPEAEDIGGRLGQQFWELCETLVQRAEDKNK